MMITSAAGVATHVASGRLRMLATAGSQRASAFPNAPTLAESGYPDVVVMGWTGLVAPTGTPYPAASIAGATGTAPDPDVALSILANAWKRRLEAWQAEGFEGTRAAWLARAHGLGKPIEVRLPNETFPAVFEALDHTGALLARLPDGTLRTVAAGDVFPVAR